jgi:hypothetical protein
MCLRVFLTSEITLHGGKMKNYLIKLLLLLLTFGGGSVSHATLMQTTWTGFIDQSSIQGDFALNLFQGVTSVSWTTTYDNESSVWHKYDDTTGTVVESFTVSSPLDIPGGYRSDAIFVFDSKIESFFAAATDTTDTHWNSQYTKFGGEDEIFVYHLNGASLWGEDSQYGNMSINYFENSPQVVVFHHTYITASVPVPPPAMPVPEPATLLLLGLGSVGFVGARVGKKKSLVKCHISNVSVAPGLRAGFIIK